MPGLLRGFQVKYSEIFQRNIGLFSQEQQGCLQTATITVAGPRSLCCVEALTLARFGIKDIRILIQRDIGGIQQGKMSLMLQWLPLGQQRMRTIFPPQCYGEIVSTLYNCVEIPFYIADRNTKTNSEKDPKLHTSRIPELNVGILEIEEVGPQCRQSLQLGQAKYQTSLPRKT